MWKGFGSPRSLQLHAPLSPARTSHVLLLGDTETDGRAEEHANRTEPKLV